jgi:hypothetical protein
MSELSKKRVRTSLKAIAQFKRVVRSLRDIVLGGQHQVKILETGKKFHKSKRPCPSRKIQVWAQVYPYTHRCIECPITSKNICKVAKEEIEFYKVCLKL